MYNFECVFVRADDFQGEVLIQLDSSNGEVSGGVLQNASKRTCVCPCTCECVCVCVCVCGASVHVCACVSV